MVVTVMTTAMMLTEVLMTMMTTMRMMTTMALIIVGETSTKPAQSSF